MKGLYFQSHVCNGCRDVLMMSINLNNIAILNIFSIDYCCITNGIGRSEAKKSLQNTNLTEKREIL